MPIAMTVIDPRSPSPFLTSEPSCERARPRLDGQSERTERPWRAWRSEVNADEVALALARERGVSDRDAGTGNNGRDVVTASEGARRAGGSVGQAQLMCNSLDGAQTQSEDDGDRGRNRRELRCNASPFGVADAGPFIHRSRERVAPDR